MLLLYYHTISKGIATEATELKLRTQLLLLIVNNIDNKPYKWLNGFLGGDDIPKLSYFYFITPGDVRQNEQVGLTSMHTLIVRLHNYVENGLHSVNPKWDGEKLFNVIFKILSNQLLFFVN